MNLYTNQVSLTTQFHTHANTCAFPYLSLQFVYFLFIFNFFYKNPLHGSDSQLY